MNARIDRARLLAGELERAIESLAAETTTRAALVFLDRVARLEALPEGERREGGVLELVDAARDLRDREAARLADRASAGLDLPGLRDRAFAVADGEADAAEWAWDALLVAAVAPDLTPARADEAERIVEEVAAIAVASPAAFAGAAAVALDRAAHETPRALRSRPARELFETLVDLPALASALAAPGPRSSRPLGLQTLLADIAAGRSTRVTPAELADAARALETGRSTADRIGGVLSWGRRGAGTPAHPHGFAVAEGHGPHESRVALAARGLPGIPEHVLLRRLPEGELLLTRRDDGVFLEWHGTGAPALALHAGEADEPLVAKTIHGGLAFRLPVERLDAASRIEFALGPSRLTVPLPSPAASAATGLAPSPLVRHLRDVEEWLPLAPASAALELRRLRDDPAATAPVRAAIDRLLAETGGSDAGVGCAFPVVPAGVAPPWLHGAVLRAAVHPGRLLPSGALDAAAAFPTEPGLQRILRALTARAGDATLAVSPNPALTPALGLTLTGDSCAAAFAIAAEAARREVEIPADAVVSAALQPGPGDTLSLAPVAGCDTKRRLLELERPGCRFFFVADPSERVEPSTRITLVPLPPGPVEALFDALLPPVAPTRSFEKLRGSLQRAANEFCAQRYPDAARAYTEALATLDRLGAAADHSDPLAWRFTALTRLGACALHAGDPAGAELRFAEATRLAGEHRSLPRVAVVELQIGVAETLVDSFRPAEAEALLRPLEVEWRRRVEDDDGVERRMALVGILATLHRAALLRGAPLEALALEEEVVGLCPRGERARALGDLGDCLRRAGRLDDALAVSRQAFDALEDMLLETYRLQTRAFLTFHAGRLALDRGELPPPASELAALRARLPERSAARWRLEMLAALSRLARGDGGGLDALTGQLAAASTPFLRWHLALALLNVARRFPSFADGARGAAVPAFRGLAGVVAAHPPLAEALARLLAAADRGTVDAGAEADLLRLRAY